MIESFFEGLVLIVDGDVGDLVDLVKTLDTVLNELGELNSGLSALGETLDDDGRGVVRCWIVE